MSRDDAPLPRPAGGAASNPPAPSERMVWPRIRVLCGDEIALGPGKVALLDSIHASGSITAAARALGMSYMRAWKLVQTMNACFREPLVTARRGGKTHGSAVLTGTGERVLALYRAMDAASREAMAATWRELRLLLR